MFGMNFITLASCTTGVVTPGEVTGVVTAGTTVVAGAGVAGVAGVVAFFNFSWHEFNSSIKLDFVDASAMVEITKANRQMLRNVTALLSAIQPMINNSKIMVYRLECVLILKEQIIV